MTYKLGIDYFLNLGVETTYGTYASSFKAPPGDLESFNPLTSEEEVIISDISSQNEVEEVLHGKTDYGFDLAFAVRDWEFLSWVMGEEGSVTGTDPYTHPLSLDTRIPSLTLEAIPESDYGKSHIFTGAKVNECVIKSVVGEKVIAELSFKSKKPTIDDTPASAQSKNTSSIFKMSSAGITVNSVSYESVAESIELAIGRNLEGLYGLDSEDINELAEGKRSCMLTLDLRTASDVVLDLLLDGAEFAVEIVFTNSVDHKVTFTFSTCKVFNIEQTIGEAVLKENLNIRVIGNWTAVVIDSIADYLS